MIRRAMVVCLSAVLVACGGGDDTDAGGDGGNGGTGSRVHRYAEFATASGTADFRTQLNTQGALGYRYVGLPGYPGASRTLFVNDAAVAYTYEVLATPTTPVAFVDQVKAQGLRGFRLASYDDRGVVYRKVTNSTETFTYEAVDSVDHRGLPYATFVANVNARGAAGFRLHSELIFGGVFFDLYEKSSTPATYAVRVEDVAATESAQLARFDTNGQAGYRMRGIHAFAEGDLWVFERDTTKANEKATFRYFADPLVASAAALVTQANGQGASGRGLEGQMNLPGGVARDLYFLAANCSGVLCDVRGPSGQ